ncbi:MAG: hypothetical protein J3T61_03595, partial [Candidatus Brocadiales bacterium]|nr:hypothetical protein [Candidatus Bathyanammoxibius sp.]
IFSNAAKKLGDKIDTEGAVPPKVLKGILDEGSFCDDSLAAEYFGGVLASSRSGVLRDDRGATFIALISRLSTYQIRSHYIFYHIIKNLFNGTNIDVGLDRDKMEIFVPLEVYDHSMDFDQQEKTEIFLPHVMFGLRKETLVGNYWMCGTKEDLEKHFKQVPAPGIIFQPTGLGIELFLWAYGRADLSVHEFLNPANQFEIESKVIIKPGYQRTKKV